MNMKELLIKECAMAFTVELPRESAEASAPSVKKRLEEGLLKQQTLSAEELAERLSRAEEKRKQRLQERLEGEMSTEYRLKAASDRRQTLISARPEIRLDQLSRENQQAAEKRRLHLHERQLERLRKHNTRVEEVVRGQVINSVLQPERLRGQISREIELAAEKRSKLHEMQLERLRRHNSRVEEVLREQAVLRSASVERLQNHLERKLEFASKRREESLQKKIQVAHQAAEHKLYFDLLEVD